MKLAQITVILLTMIQDQSRGYALGAADYLLKPIDRRKLVSALRSHLSVSPKHVLVVEDDLDTRQMVARTLTREGWTVDQAATGQQGLDRIAEATPALILLDLLMPDTDGFQFVDHLQKHEVWKDIPVIVITAKDLGAAERERLNGHVEQILQKGAYNRKELLDLVSELVRRSLSTNLKTS